MGLPSCLAVSHWHEFLPPHIQIDQQDPRPFPRKNNRSSLAIAYSMTNGTAA